jgi:hypothetical protein
MLTAAMQQHAEFTILQGGNNHVFQFFFNRFSLP